MTDTSFDRGSFVAGVRAAIPLAIPSSPFGLIIGYLITETPIPRAAGVAMSQIIFAGSAQLVAMEQFGDSAAGIVIIATVFMINSRHLMYSAAMKPYMRGAPRWFRFVGGYLLVDQVFALADLLDDDTPLRSRMWQWLGAGITLWTNWQIWVVVGLAVGQVIPESWSLTFAVPLMFGGLMILGLKNRPGVIAAIVGGTIALLARDLPQGSGLVLGILLGMSAGALADLRLERSSR